MPLYEYRCDKCGQVFEVLQKLSDPALTTHEGCGGAVEKLISVSGLQFKGSGFYITDYSRGSAPASAGKSDSGSKSESKSEASDSKPSDSSSKSETSSTPAPASSSTPAASTKSD